MKTCSIHDDRGFLDLQLEHDNDSDDSSEIYAERKWRREYEGECLREAYEEEIER